MSGGRVGVQTADRRLREINEIIMRHERRRDELIEAAGPCASIKVEKDFLKILYRRRDGILWEIEKAERQALQSGCHVDTGGLT